jgi:hypothetical protein
MFPRGSRGGLRLSGAEIIASVRGTWACRDSSLNGPLRGCVLARGWGEDQCLSIPRGFASRSVAIGVAVVLGAVCLSAIGAATARASLGVFYNEVGTLRLSVDAIGTNAESGIVRAETPPGATVRKAFLFAASTGELRFLPPDGEVTLDGSEVSWDPSHIISTNINSYNVAADVTSLVKPKLS